MIRKQSILDIIFQEKVIIYAILPFLISFSFFGILVEVTKNISRYSSPYFLWYPVYFVFILPFSIYTNSSIFAGGKFLRSVVETLFEIFLLLLFNFIFLKGFSFGKSINEFIDVSFGISVAFWIAMRIVNGHIVRSLNFPYEVLTSVANSLANSIKLEEVFEEKYFEKRSVKRASTNLMVSFGVMFIFVSLGLILSGSNLVSLLYTFIFITSSISLVVNVSKVYILEDSFIKKVNIDNIEFTSKIVRFLVFSSVIVVLCSSVLSVGIYFASSEVSKRVSLALREKINEMMAKERKVSEEEIKRIRERLLSESVTNEYTPRPIPERKERKGIDWLLVMFVLQYLLILLAVVVAIGFILKRVLKVSGIPVLDFFIKVYDIFAYIAGKILRGVVEILKRLFLRRRRVYVPSGLEEEVLASMQIRKEEMSKEKIEEIETIVKIFIDMLFYTSYVLPYKRTMGVEEYCEGLKVFLPEFSRHLEFISNVVNESRYSNHLLPKSYITELKEKVGEIVSKVRLKVKVAEEFRGG